MTEQSNQQKWACFRFSIIGPLMASPAKRNELKERIKELSLREWTDPVNGQPRYFKFSTIERWYYKAKNAGLDPVSKLRRPVRKDCGSNPSISEAVKKALQSQYQMHSGWSCQLHYDNVKAMPELDQVASYSSIGRFMKKQGWRKTRHVAAWRRTAGTEKAARRLVEKEVRSYESEYVNALWHLDFHKGSLPVVNAQGQWEFPQMMAVLDDCSRLICHGQWYFAEDAENLIHGLNQAFAKRALPRSLMSDNGSAMIAAETKEGLKRLGVHHEYTLAYSPYQNGKQEVFWAQIEGRLLAMLENRCDLTLNELNLLTQAYLEMEYNRKVHSEIKRRPIDVYLNVKDVGRPCPEMQSLEKAFTRTISRKQRRSDGTVSIDGVRFEIPSQYRHLEHLSLRFRFWDLSHAYLFDQKTDSIIIKIYPQDKIKNAEAKRALNQPIGQLPETEIETEPNETQAPLLDKILKEYQSLGLPPAYLSKD